MPVAAELLITQVAQLAPRDLVAGDEFGTAVTTHGEWGAVGTPADDDAGQSSGSVYVFRRNEGGADIWGQVAKLVATETAEGDQFGTAVAMDDQRLLVGAPGTDITGPDSGAAYLFERGKDGTWQQLLRLTVDASASGDQFGQAVTLTGDRLYISAPFSDNSRGAVYVFSRDAEGEWLPTATLQGVQPGGRFGTDLAALGDWLLVGAPMVAATEQSSGAAYLYRPDLNTPEGWQRIATLQDDSTNGFGSAVDVGADRVVIGSPGMGQSGMVHLFERNQGGMDRWGRVISLQAPRAENDDRFGVSVALDNDILVVGASGIDSVGPNAGAIYLFERNQGGAGRWGNALTMVANRIRAGDFFGEALAIQEGTLLVGVRSRAEAGVNSGAAYVFQQSGNQWQPQAAPLAAQIGANKQFGYSVALAADTLVVGSHFDSAQDQSLGSAYIFQRNRGGAEQWGQVARLIAGTTTGFDRFGQAVALSGDTAVVGALGDDEQGQDTGAAFVFQRNAGGADAWQQTDKLTATDGALGDSFGSAVAISGNTIVIGAFADDDVGQTSGSAYVFQRPTVDGRWQQTAKLVAQDADATDQFGIATAIDGDTIVVGAHFESQVGNFAGAAYVFERYQGGQDNWGQTAKLLAEDGASNDQFGYTVSIKGNRIAIGAPGKRIDSVATGAVYLFERDMAGQPPWRQTLTIHSKNSQMGDQFGYSVSLSENILAVGARFHDGLNPDVGAVYLFAQNQSGTDRWGQIAKLEAPDQNPDNRFGAAVSLEQDILVVGAPYQDRVGSRSGAVHLYRWND